MKEFLLFGKMGFTATRRTHDEYFLLLKSQSSIELMSQRFDVFILSRFKLFLSDFVLFYTGLETYFWNPWELKSLNFNSLLNLNCSLFLL